MVAQHQATDGSNERKTADSVMTFDVHGLDVDDETARGIALKLYTILNDAGHDVDGVAPVLTGETDE